jgi:hypothetical protein
VKLPDLKGNNHDRLMKEWRPFSSENGSHSFITRSKRDQLVCRFTSSNGGNAVMLGGVTRKKLSSTAFALTAPGAVTRGQVRSRNRQLRFQDLVPITTRQVRDVRVRR